MLSKNHIQFLQNIEVIERERGKVCGRHFSHNIVVASGCTWLAQLTAGDVTSRIAYLGVGIGGSKQNFALADQAPLDVYTPVAARSQTDQDATVAALERPVAISSSSTPVTPGADVWLKGVSGITYPAAGRVCFTFVLTELDVSFGSFSMVPISEVGLFTSDKNPTIQRNQLVAYDTMYARPKTTAVAMELRWTFIYAP